MSEVRNSIVGSAEVDPTTLNENNLNWRMHPNEQRKALEATLDRVGWVQRVIVNINTNNVVDGHLRLSVAKARKEPTVPVVYVDLTEAEERLALATYDPIGSLASADKDTLGTLLGSLDNTDQSIGDMLTKTAVDAGVMKAKPGEGDGDTRSDKPRPKTGIEVYGFTDHDNSFCCSLSRAGVLVATTKTNRHSNVHSVALYAPQTLTEDAVRSVTADRYVIRCYQVDEEEKAVANVVTEIGAQVVYMTEEPPQGIPLDAVVAYDVDAALYDIEESAPHPLILIGKDLEKIIELAGKFRDRVVGVASPTVVDASARGELILWKRRIAAGKVAAPLPLDKEVPTIKDIGVNVPHPEVIAVTINAATWAMAFSENGI